jgi:UDP-N-acetylglucosamine acyltransferase
VASDVRIGPYAIIDGPAVIGPRCVIHSCAVISGTVRMGRNNHVGYGAVIGAEPQDYSFKPTTRSEVVIGNNNKIREYCTIHRGTMEGSATVVGNDNFFMAGTHLGHNVHAGSHITIANGVLLAGHVEVQDHVFIGGGSAFHQFLRIGRGALTQGNSTFTKDIPPFTIAAVYNTVIGVSSEGLRRAGLGAEARKELRAAFKLLYKSGWNKTQALERAAAMEWKTDEGRRFFEFIATSKKRGICESRDARSVARLYSMGLTPLYSVWE